VNWMFSCVCACAFLRGMTARHTIIAIEQKLGPAVACTRDCLCQSKYVCLDAMRSQLEVVAHTILSCRSKSWHPSNHLQCCSISTALLVVSLPRSLIHFRGWSSSISWSKIMASGITIGTNLSGKRTSITPLLGLGN